MNLTPKQTEVLLWVQRGLSNKQIAKRMNIAESTVKLHVGAVMEKHGVRTRTQLAVFSIQDKAATIDMEGLEQEPVGWIKRVGKRVYGIVFTKKPPAEDWEPIYTKEQDELQVPPRFPVSLETEPKT